jgi:hypothetical protein
MIEKKKTGSYSWDFAASPRNLEGTCLHSASAACTLKVLGFTKTCKTSAIALRISALGLLTIAGPVGLVDGLLYADIGDH